MKTTKVKVEVNVPNWLYRYRWKNLKNYFSYQLNPYRCMDCGVKMPHKHGDVELYDLLGPMKARLTVGYTTLDGSICQHCLIKRIDKLAASAEFLNLQKDDIKQTCDVCEEEKMALKTIKMSEKLIDNVRFCTHGSWNGHHVCLDCAKLALQNGVTKSGIFSHYKGKYTSMNQHNLPVVGGKARFPDH